MRSLDFLIPQQTLQGQELFKSAKYRFFSNGLSVKFRPFRLINMLEKTFIISLRIKSLYKIINDLSHFKKLS